MNDFDLQDQNIVIAWLDDAYSRMREVIRDAEKALSYIDKARKRIYDIPYSDDDGG